MNWTVGFYFGFFSFLGGLIALTVENKLVLWTFKRVKAGRWGPWPPVRHLTSALMAGLIGGLLTMALEKLNTFLVSL